MRELSGNVISEKEQDQTRPVELYDIYLGSQTEVDSDTLFFAVCPETIHFWDMEDTPQDYLPIGIKRSQIKHNMDLAVDYFNAGIDNVNRAVGALIAGIDFRNKRVVLRSIFLDKLESPEDATMLFDGVIDKPSITENSMGIQVVSRLELKKKTGRLYQLMCGWIFGGSHCAFDRASTSAAGNVETNSTTSIIYDTTNRTEADDYWNDGVIVFSTGVNNRQKRRVTNFDNATGGIAMDIILPNTPAVGDNYTIYQGCDKTLSICNSRFSNRVNYGGFHTLPIENPENL